MFGKITKILFLSTLMIGTTYASDGEAPCTTTMQERFTTFVDSDLGAIYDDLTLRSLLIGTLNLLDSSRMKKSNGNRDHDLEIFTNVLQEKVDATSKDRNGLLSLGMQIPTFFQNEEHVEVCAQIAGSKQKELAAALRTYAAGPFMDPTNTSVILALLRTK